MAVAKAVPFFRRRVEDVAATRSVRYENMLAIADNVGTNCVQGWPTHHRHDRRFGTYWFLSRRRLFGLLQRIVGITTGASRVIKCVDAEQQGA